MKYLIILCLLLSVKVSFCQMVVFKENFKSITDIDQNNWAYSLEFKIGDTAKLLSISKVNGDYAKINSNGKTVFVYESTISEVDDFFEKKRLKMDSLKLFITAKQIKSFKKGDTVKLLNANIGNMGIPNVIITNGSEEIETSLENLKVRPSLNVIATQMIQKNSEKETIQEAKALQERNKRLKAKYGEMNFKRMMKGETWIGMTETMFLEMKGKPEKVNRTVSSSGAKEQWVYGYSYYYFENGKLTTWQD